MALHVHHAVTPASPDDGAAGPGSGRSRPARCSPTRGCGTSCSGYAPGMADTELLEDFSKLIGERRVVTPTVSHGPGGPSTSETHRWERLAPVEELRTLPEENSAALFMCFVWKDQALILKENWFLMQPLPITIISEAASAFTRTFLQLAQILTISRAGIPVLFMSLKDMLTAGRCGTS